VSLPVNLVTVRVTGRYLLPDGTADTGTVMFIAPTFLADGSDVNPAFISETRLIATLVNGVLTGLDSNPGVLIPASTNGALNPTGFTWNVYEKLSGSSRYYSITLPSGTSPIDLTTLAPASASSGAPVSQSLVVPQWTPSTVYLSGQLVLNPSGQLVAANVGFTSGSSYSAGNWTVISGSGGGAVASVAGRTGVVVLSTSDISGLGTAAAHAATDFDAAGAASTAQTAATSAAESFATSAISTQHTADVAAFATIGEPNSAAETTRAEAAEALLAPKASPTLTGIPAAPTAAALTNTTQLATTAYSDAATGVEKTRALAAEALLAPLAAPTFTGHVTVPTGTNGTDAVNLKQANGSYVAPLVKSVAVPVAAPLPFVNVKDYAAIGNGVTLLDGVMSMSTNPTYFTSASAVFTAADVGKAITVDGAGAAGAQLVTTITAYTSATAVTLAAGASTTVAAAITQYANPDTVAITNAIAALPNNIGCLYFPAGTYYIPGGISVTKNDVQFIGMGTSTTFVGNAGDTLVTVTNCSRFRMSGFQFARGLIGLYVNGAIDSHFADMWATGQTTAAYKINGDAAMEVHFTDVVAREVPGIGFNYVRTSTSDTGGLYLTRCRSIYSTVGTHGYVFTSSAANTTAFIWMTNCVADGYADDAVTFNNIASVNIAACFFSTRSTAATLKAALRITAGYDYSIANTYTFQGSASNTAFCVVVAGSAHEVLVSNHVFDGAGTNTALGLSAAGASFLLGQYHCYLATLTDTPTALTAGNGSQYAYPTTTWTNSGAGATEAQAVADGANPASAKKFWRNNNGTLELLNGAFSTGLMRWFDNGDIAAYQTFYANRVQLTSGAQVGDGSTARATLWSVSGAPATGLGSVGDFAFRIDTPTTANQRLYVKSGASTWTALL
jgi:hypothetical protein